MRRLRIAQIAPLVERVPPKKYGGTERVVHTLTEELVKRGHEVTLFASGDSITSAKLISSYHRSLRESKVVRDPYGLNDYALLNVANAYKMQNEFDIIHDHTGHLGLQSGHFSKTPVVMTIHGAFTPTKRRMLEILNNPYFVCISKDQSNYSGNVKITDVIYNGLNMKDYPFSKETKNFLLYVGRISLDKGAHYAIEVANALNLKLVIAAKLDTVDKPYFYEHVEPMLYNDEVKWIGEVDQDQRNLLMSEALCFLHPATWREPFGLTLIEAMACGCPVVAFKKGSIPEIVIDGKTGFVVSEAEDMIEAVTKISSINREDCRRHVLDNFSGVKMADNYENLYYKILEKNI